VSVLHVLFQVLPLFELFGCMLDWQWSD
jgi:hypothetical protein